MREKLRAAVLPGYAVVFSVVMLLPLVVIFPAAFGTGASFEFPPSGFTMKWFAKAADQQEFIDGFWLSLGVAVGASLLASAVGLPAAWGLSRSSSPFAKAATAFLTSPLVVPSVVFGVGALLALSLVGFARTVPGFLAAHLVICLPYILRLGTAAFKGVPSHVEEMASLLGASRLYVFRTVTLPLARAGLVGAVLFSFIISFDEYTVSFLISGPTAEPLPIAIGKFLDFELDPTLAAVSVVLVAISAAVMVLIEKVVGVDKIFSY